MIDLDEVLIIVLDCFLFIVLFLLLKSLTSHRYELLVFFHTWSLNRLRQGMFFE